jgi:hypothetical protein
MPGPEGDYQLALPFDTEHPEFARGFEAAATFKDLKATDEPLTVVMQGANTEMAMRIAEATHRKARSVDLDGDFIEVHFSAPRP